MPSVPRRTRTPAAAISAAIPAGENGVDATPVSPSERSLALLALVAQQGRTLPLTEIANLAGLPKATAHRICGQLVTSGFLSRGLAEKSFSVGPALRKLAFDTLNHGVERGLRHAVLSDLVAQIGETCNLTTLDGAQVLYLDRVEAQWPLRLTLDVGSHVPLHCTASGKLFLAQMEPRTRVALIDELPLARMTRATLTTAKALRAECAQIREQGYACDREEFIAGLIAVAVPVLGADGTMRAAIAVHAPVARLALKAALARLPSLQAAAARIGAWL